MCKSYCKQVYPGSPLDVRFTARARTLMNSMRFGRPHVEQRLNSCEPSTAPGVGLRTRYL